MSDRIFKEFKVDKYNKRAGKLIFSEYSNLCGTGPYPGRESEYFYSTKTKFFSFLMLYSSSSFIFFFTRAFSGTMAKMFCLGFFCKLQIHNKNKNQSMKTSIFL